MNGRSLSPAEISGLTRIKRLSLLAGAQWVGFPMAFVLGVLAVFLGHISGVASAIAGVLSVTVGAGSLVVGGLSSIRYSLSRCPRCEQLFLKNPGSKWWSLWPTRSCRSCGLSLREGDEPGT